MTFGPVNSLSSYLPVEFEIPDDPTKLQEFLMLRELLTADVINSKESGNYDLIQQMNGQVWFVVGDNQTKRYAYRSVFNRGTLAAGGIDTFVHDIGSIVTPLKLYGFAITGAVDFRPIPYMSVTAVNQGIEIRADATNIIVSNGAAATAITSYIVVFEYLQN